MTKEQARYQALSAGGAMLITFIGVCHEFVGLTLFPGAEVYFGGLVGWHLAGLSCIAVGLVLLAASLGLIRFKRVAAVALVVAVLAVGVMILAAVERGQFHVFALAAFIAGALIAWCYPKSLPQ